MALMTYPTLPVGLDVTADFKGGGSVPIGKPIANTSCYVLDPHLQLQPVGLPGELMVGGVQVCRGYLKRPDLTAEKFIPNPYAAGRPLHSRLYRTGAHSSVPPSSWARTCVEMCAPDIANVHQKQPKTEPPRSLLR